MKPIIFLSLFAIFAFSQCVPTNYKRLKAAYDEMQRYNKYISPELEIHSLDSPIGKKRMKESYSQRYIQLKDSLFSDKIIQAEILIESFIEGGGIDYVYFFWVENKKGFISNLSHFYNNDSMNDFKTIELKESELNKIMSLFNYFTPTNDDYFPHYYDLDCDDILVEGGGSYFYYLAQDENVLFWANIFNCMEITDFIIGIETSDELYKIRNTIYETYEKYQ